MSQEEELSLVMAPAKKKNTPFQLVACKWRFQCISFHCLISSVLI